VHYKPYRHFNRKLKQKLSYRSGTEWGIGSSEYIDHHAFLGIDGGHLLVLKEKAMMQLFEKALYIRPQVLQAKICASHIHRFAVLDDLADRSADALHDGLVKHQVLAPLGNQRIVHWIIFSSGRQTCPRN